jgi:hypothetical protein
MTAPTCQNCKYWETEIQHHDYRGVHPCSFLTDQISAACHEETSYVMVEPTFSCNQHQPRET